MGLKGLGFWGVRHCFKGSGTSRFLIDSGICERAKSRVCTELLKS